MDRTARTKATSSVAIQTDSFQDHVAVNLVEIGAKVDSLSRPLPIQQKLTPFRTIGKLEISAN